jgi:hypothetical protein
MSDLNDSNNCITILKDMLEILEIKFETIDELIEIEIEKNDITNKEVCEHFQKYQEKLKNLGYKTGNLTSLHKNNQSKQKWPSVNMLRQILKCNKLHLKPLVKSYGYDKSNGKKNTIRYYIIKPILN